MKNPLFHSDLLTGHEPKRAPLTPSLSPRQTRGEGACRAGEGCSDARFQQQFTGSKRGIVTLFLLACMFIGPALFAQVAPDSDQPSPDQDSPRRQRPPRPPEPGRGGPPSDLGPRPFGGPGGAGMPQQQEGGYSSFGNRGMMGEPYFGVPPGRMESRTLIVGAAKLDAPAVAALEEDLTVMAHLLEKTLANDLGQAADSAMGISVLSRGNSRVSQSLYLGGYGVLFQIGVSFPLLPPGDKTQEDRKPKPAVSPWAEAHREIFGPRDRGEGWMSAGPFGRRPAEYLPERIETLKHDLLAALKNSANIRNLKPDEFITIMVTGSDNRPGWPPSRRMGASGRRPGGGAEGGGEGAPGNEGAARVPESPLAGHQAVLSIRVTRADVDAVAQGKLTPEDFRKRASINLE